MDTPSQQQQQPSPPPSLSPQQDQSQGQEQRDSTPQPQQPQPSSGPAEATLIDLHQDPPCTDQAPKKPAAGKRGHSKMIPSKPLPLTPKPPTPAPRPKSLIETEEAVKINLDKIFEVPVTYESPTSVSPAQLVEDIQKHLIKPAFCDVAVAAKIRGQAGGCATVLALVEEGSESAIFVLTLLSGSLVLTDTIPLTPGVVGRVSKNTSAGEQQQQQQQQEQGTKNTAFIELIRKGKSTVVFETADPTAPTSSLTMTLFEQIIPAKAAASAPSALDLLSGSQHSWLNKYPKRHIDESLFSTKVDIIPVKVFFGTWNVNGQKPPPSLSLWLVQENVYPDIYCIGFQELDLSASALVRKDTPKAEPWENLIQSTLEGVGDYAKLCTKQLAGILLCVFVRRGLADRITDVQTDLMPVGLLGKMGNKGGVAIRFNINDTSFCVVNTHLNAGIGNVERRNQDYHDIAGSLGFPASGGRRITIWDHQFLFWIGDLNYRVDAPNEDVREKVRRGDFAGLLADDQLYAQMRAKAAFDDFTEAPITFAPTYKYDKNSTEYDSRQQPRIPAYCDRVLWRIHEGEKLTTLSYARHELLPSDHRPVSATFVLSTKSGVDAAWHSLLQATGSLSSPSPLSSSSSSSSSTAAGAANDSEGGSTGLLSSSPASSLAANAQNSQGTGISGVDMLLMPGDGAADSNPAGGDAKATISSSSSSGGPPAITISDKVIDFGTLGYGETRERKLVVTNKGRGPGRWGFVKRPGRSEVCQAWLRITPAAGVLAAGAQETVTLSATVDSSSAKLLCTIAPDSNLLKDVLVVHADGGADHFIALNGCYARSCFGMTPDQLTHYPGPVRTTPPDKDRTLLVPKELWRLADHIAASCPDAPDLFSAAADPACVPLIRDALDTGQALALHDFAPKDVSNALVEFLRALGEPFIPPQLVIPLIRAPSYAGCKELIARVLPDVSYASLYYTLSFLRELLRHSEKNHLTPERLAIIFSTVLLRLPNNMAMDPAMKKDADFVIYRFLNLDDDGRSGK